MTNEQQRLEVQATIMNMANQLMYQNGVPASVVEDALTKALVAVKDATIQEFIRAVSAETAAAMKQEQEKKEEDSGE